MQRNVWYFCFEFFDFSLSVSFTLIHSTVTYKLLMDIQVCQSISNSYPFPSSIYRALLAPESSENFSFRAISWMLQKETSFNIEFTTKFFTVQYLPFICNESWYHHQISSILHIIFPWFPSSTTNLKPVLNWFNS